MSIITRSRGCLLVYNPISGHGHLDSWNAIVVSMLVEKGWHVLALTPGPDALVRRLAQRGVACGRDVEVLEWIDDPRTPTPVSLMRRAMRSWVDFCHPYVTPQTEDGDASKTPGNAASEWLCKLAIPPLFFSTRFVYRLLRREKNAELPDVAPSPPTGAAEEAGADPSLIARRVERALRDATRRPALFINMYLDDCAASPSLWERFEAENPLPWVGFRFVPDHDGGEAWCALPSFRGMYLLDEGACSRYAQKYPDRHFACLPDITDDARNETPCHVARQILARAAGRKIVLLCGSIGRQKNLGLWFDLIEMADPAKWFFAQVGEVHYATLPVEERVRLEKEASRKRENVLIHRSYLSDDREFNDVVCASDYLFAVYRDFPISSNMINKAAIFAKPIIVSQSFLMGRRVERYGIGLAVPENDCVKVHDALLHLEAHAIPAERFENCARDLAPSKFSDRLDGLIRRIRKAGLSC